MEKDVPLHPPTPQKRLRARPRPDAKADGYYAKMERMYPRLMAALSKL